MNCILKLFPLLLLTPVLCIAQNKQPSDFIPEEYIEFGSYLGDLNNDGQEDVVLIIKNTIEDSIVTNRFDEVVDRNRRGIIVLFKNGKGFQLADKNYNCFSSENEDGGVYFPPQMSIEILNGKLYINYGHGRYGHWKYTFRFQDGSFKLIGFDSSSNSGLVINQETSINFLTKKKLVRENTNMEAEGGDETFEETWTDIVLEELIELSKIEGFDELNMYSY